MLLLALACCSPAKRLERLTRRHPELTRPDTVTLIRRDTVPGARKDTVVYFRQRDTLVIRERQLTMKYYLGGDSTVYLYGRCDTVVRVDTLRIPYRRVAPPEESRVSWMDRMERVLAVVGLAAILIFLLRRK